MIHVKICGLTRLEDVEWAIECGAESVGFVFEPSSPRYVGGSEAFLERALRLASSVRAVAVFGPAPSAFTDDRFTAVQAIGERPPGVGEFVRAIRLDDEATVESVLAQAGSADTILLDAHAEGAFGGTGRRVDWGLAAEVVRAASVPVILAGGLDPDNVAQAIDIVRPAGVDVSSGVEEAPGIKSKDLIRRFIEAARSPA